MSEWNSEVRGLDNKVEILLSKVKRVDRSVEELYRRVMGTMIMVLHLLRELSSSLPERNVFPDDNSDQSGTMFGAWTILPMIGADLLKKKADHLYHKFHRAVRVLTSVLHLLRNLSTKSHIKDVLY